VRARAVDTADAAVGVSLYSTGRLADADRVRTTGAIASPIDRLVTS
jgi:hypothetical protein